MADKRILKCHVCSGDHWALRCPWINTVLEKGTDDKKSLTLIDCTSAMNSFIKSTGSKYVLPSTTTIRISNLSDSTTETDLEELLRPFGPFQKLFLAKDKATGACKGFAYIHFKFRNDAAKAIDMLNGYGYNHFILVVDWSKPVNKATTIVAEDVYLQVITNKKEEKQEEESGIDKLKTLGDKKILKCRVCSGDHWTTKCPWRDDSTAIRISNLSDSTTETDLEELVRPFGPIQKLFLAKDKTTGACKGFAYIHFKFRNDAAKAIDMLNGYGYNHFILVVDWSKPLFPNSATTIVADDVSMQVITNKKEEKQEVESGIDKLKTMGDKKILKCRVYSGGHWTTKCPRKGADEKKPTTSGMGDKKILKCNICRLDHLTTKCPWRDSVLVKGTDDKKPTTSDSASRIDFSKYVPLNMSKGAVKRSDNPIMTKRDYSSAIRISNLRKSITGTDLEELARPFGPTQSLHLCKDKRTGACNGFGFICFKFENDAAKAIDTLNGYWYHYFRLKVDWLAVNHTIKKILNCPLCSHNWTTIRSPQDNVLVKGIDVKKPTDSSGMDSSKCVPPSEGGIKRSDNPNISKRDNSNAISISKLSVSTTEIDLEELVRPFRPIQQLFLAKHEGFAYVYFKFRNDAAKAIATLNGYSYHNCILKAAD